MEVRRSIYIEYAFDERDQVDETGNGTRTVSGDEVITVVEGYKCLGSFVQKNGGFDGDAKHKIRREWME